MSITHIVLFQFKPTTSAAKIEEVSTRMLALKNSCLHPSTKQSYIVSVKGGIDNSPEGAQNDLTHAFIVEFESVKDRDYYVNDDPVHGEFKSLAGEILEKVVVVDFTAGVFH